MTEPTGPPAPEPAAGPPEPTGVPEPEPSDHVDPEVRRARSEAAGLRRRLREAEATATTATTALEALRTNEVLRVAGTLMADGRDLLALGGVTVADLLNEDGSVDPAKIATATEALLADRPHLASRPAPRSTRPVESLQVGSGAALATPPEPEGPTWGQVLGRR